jgi:hypothetical protein
MSMSMSMSFKPREIAKAKTTKTFAAKHVLCSIDSSEPVVLVKGHNWFLNQFVEIPRRS